MERKIRVRHPPDEALSLTKMRINVRTSYLNPNLKGLANWPAVRYQAVAPMCRSW